MRNSNHYFLDKNMDTAQKIDSWIGEKDVFR